MLVGMQQRQVNERISATSEQQKMSTSSLPSSEQYLDAIEQRRSSFVAAATNLATAVKLAKTKIGLTVDTRDSVKVLLQQSRFT
jgi:hypothetical protein